MRKSFWSALAISAAAGVVNGGGIEAVRNMPLENGEIVYLERETDPVLKYRKNRPLKNLPPRTVAKVVLHPAPGSNINVQVYLPDPDKWNGRFVGLGNGGAAGSINPQGMARLAARGFAAANTDMGTSPDAFSGDGNPEVWKDFGFRSTHLMTVTAKKIIKAFYGRAPEYSYFNGGSTGGQQALSEVQRYPEDYDGVVAAVPAHCRTPLHAYFLWNYQILNRTPFSKEQEKVVIDAANEYMAKYETGDGKGKYISDTRRATAEDIKNIIALARKKDATLTDAHAEALDKLFSGPVHPETGERIFNGIPVGSPFDPARGNLYLFNWVFGKDCDLNKLNFTSDLDEYTAKLGPYLNSEDPDLRRFADRGGKLLMFSGSADSCVPFHATLDYYEKTAEFFGSLDKVKEFFLFYLVPGKGHGNEGPGVNAMPDMLEKVILWREKGEKPGELTAKRYEKGHLVSTIAIQPYPGNSPRGGVGRVAPRYLPEIKE